MLRQCAHSAIVDATGHFRTVGKRLDGKKWLTPKQAVSALEDLGMRVSEKFLYRRRRNEGGPPFWQNGGRVYYRDDLLENWFQQQIHEG